MTVRWVIGVLMALVFIEYCIIYGSRVWRMSWPEKVAWLGSGGILLSGVAEQYKLARLLVPADWVTLLIFASEICALIGFTATLLETRRREKDLP